MRDRTQKLVIKFKLIYPFCFSFEISQQLYVECKYRMQIRQASAVLYFNLRVDYYRISVKLSFVTPIIHYVNVYLFSRIIKSILKEKMQTAKGFKRRPWRTMFLTGFNFNFSCNVSLRRRECIRIKRKSRKCALLFVHGLSE